MQVRDKDKNKPVHDTMITTTTKPLNKKQAPWPEPASELYRLSDRHLSAKLVPTFADRGCHVVSVTDP
jgi:hypothetical protein